MQGRALRVRDTLYSTYKTNKGAKNNAFCDKNERKTKK